MGDQSDSYCILILGLSNRSRMLLRMVNGPRVYGVVLVSVLPGSGYNDDDNKNNLHLPLP